MTARRRRVHPDQVVDADRGSSGAVGTKQAEVLDLDSWIEREAERDGARGLDATVERMPGLTRQRKDRERALPRDTTAALGDPRKQRRLPVGAETRRLLSSRQRKARSVTKRAAQDRWTHTQHQTLHELMSSPEQWRRLNDRLSDAAGDAQALSEQDRQSVQRLDRAVQAYERMNDRGHVVYCNVRMPDVLGDTGSLHRRAFPRGQQIAFDRFTGASHTLHELDQAGPVRDSIAFEIQTRRGLYLGRSDGVNDTAHLLPRGLRLQVVGRYPVTYERPDGSLGRRQVVQLIDITPTEEPA